MDYHVLLKNVLSQLIQNKKQKIILKMIETFTKTRQRKTLMASYWLHISVQYFFDSTNNFYRTWNNQTIENNDKKFSKRKKTEETNHKRWL